MQHSVFTRRSVIMATSVGLAVAAVFVVLAGDMWELALPICLTAGALALVTPLQVRDGRFFSQGGRHVRIVQMLAFQIVFLLGYVTATAIGLDRTTGLLLGILIVVAGGAVYSLGFVGGALHQIEDDDATEAHTTISLHR